MLGVWNRLTRALARKHLAGTASVHWPGDSWQTDTPAPSRDRRRFSTVFSCVQIVSTDVAKIPLKHWRRTPDGGRIELRDTPVARVLRKPNHYQTLVELLQQFMTGLLHRGNAYILIQRGAKFEPTALYCISPDRCAPYVAPDGSIFYNVSRDPMQVPTTAASLFPARDVIHHRINTFHHPLIGMAPIDAAAETADAQAAIVSQTRAFFNRRALPSGILTSPKRLSKEVKDRTREAWENFYAGPNAGRTAVLEDGLEWKQVMMTAEQSQTIELLQWQTNDIARVFGVPLHRLGELDRVTYRNAETLQRVYLSNTLGWHLTGVESRWSASFDLGDRDEYLDFDADALLRLETDARFDALSKGVQGGILTPNEARQREALNPVTGGDSLFLQAQMTPVDQLSREPEPAPEPEPDPEPLLLPAPEDVRASVRRSLALRRAA